MVVADEEKGKKEEVEKEAGGACSSAATSPPERMFCFLSCLASSAEKLETKVGWISAASLLE